MTGEARSRQSVKTGGSPKTSWQRVHDKGTAQALDLAKRLIAAGVPVIAVGKNDAPRQRWSEIRTAADCDLSRYREGDALAIIGGHGIDLVDVDAKAGGAVDNLPPFKHYGITRTPSGGAHYVVPSAGIRKLQDLSTAKGFVGDYVGGTADGEGRLLGFLPGSIRTKYPDGGYVEEVPWDIEGCLAAEPDPVLVEALLSASSKGHPSSRSGQPKPAEPPRELEPAEAERLQAHAERFRQVQLARLDALPRPWKNGAHWDDTVYEVACMLVRLANTWWTPLTDDDMLVDLVQRAPKDKVWTQKKVLEKWESATKSVGDGQLDWPGDDSLEAAAADFGLQVAESGGTGEPTDLPRVDDAHLSSWIPRRELSGDWRWVTGLGWHHWDGVRWRRSSDEEARNAVRRAVIRINTRALHAGLSPHRLKAFYALLSAGRIGAITNLMRGVTSLDADQLDRQPDLLNVGNGVVDLRTGELKPHDKQLMMTKITTVNYVPGARHPDWDQALTSLEPEVMDWMQVRVGQAATGHPTSDDKLTIDQGGGSNGKTTFFGALANALQEHLVVVPDKVLLANPNDHPTELMTLLGARVALIDETPEEGHIDVQRLKRVLGGELPITARLIGKNNVSWKPTHSLFIQTNYEPILHQTDHGTWRRFALVRFEKTFPQDDRFRARLLRGADGRAEAVLAWVVEGARRWYANDKTIPPPPEKVRADTETWRGQTDLIRGFVEDMLVFDRSACIRAVDLLEQFNEWAAARNHKRLSDKTLAARFGSHSDVKAHSVFREKLRNPEGLSEPPYGSTAKRVPRAWVWTGVRWGSDSDYDEPADSAGSWASLL